jgi:hypothetical protein
VDRLKSEAVKPAINYVAAKAVWGIVGAVKSSIDKSKWGEKRLLSKKRKLQDEIANTLRENKDFLKEVDDLFKS